MADFIIVKRVFVVGGVCKGRDGEWLSGSTFLHHDFAHRTLIDYLKRL